MTLREALEAIEASVAFTVQYLESDSKSWGSIMGTHTCRLTSKQFQLKIDGESIDAVNLANWRGIGSDEREALNDFARNLNDVIASGKTVVLRNRNLMGKMKEVRLPPVLDYEEHRSMDLSDVLYIINGSLEVRQLQNEDLKRPFYFVTLKDNIGNTCTVLRPHAATRTNASAAALTRGAAYRELVNLLAGSLLGHDWPLMRGSQVRIPTTLRIGHPTITEPQLPTTSA